MLTMEDLKSCFQEATLMNAKYIGVKIDMYNCPNPEIIINPCENFTNKIKYYIEAYNDDLTLKAFNKIKIVNFTYANTFEEIETMLGDNYDNL